MVLQRPSSHEDFRARYAVSSVYQMGVGRQRLRCPLPLSGQLSRESRLPFWTKRSSQARVRCLASASCSSTAIGRCQVTGSPGWQTGYAKIGLAVVVVCAWLEAVLHARVESGRIISTLIAPPQGRNSFGIAGRADRPTGYFGDPASVGICAMNVPSARQPSSHNNRGR